MTRAKKATDGRAMAKINTPSGRVFLLTSWPRVSRQRTGRSVRIPSTPRSLSCSMSSCSLTVQTYTVWSVSEMFSRNCGLSAVATWLRLKFCTPSKGRSGTVLLIRLRPTVGQVRRARSKKA
eukprot:Lithocolla_globosa_v1_NODE_5845_length_1176_cov_154.438894.p2 type:complete len:122 gc:universal NODE_5845_length_1176_cov_154.438894:974-609(-)